MRNSTRLSDTVHLLATIQIIREVTTKQGGDLKARLSSAAIAKSIHSNASYVRQLMMAVNKAGLLHCERGRANPTLARQAKDISLLDIYRAVEQDKPLLQLDTHINPECNVGKGIQLALGLAYNEIQKSAEARMASISLQSIINDFYARVGDDTLPD